MEQTAQNGAMQEWGEERERERGRGREEGVQRERERWKRVRLDLLFNCARETAQASLCLKL